MSIDARGEFVPQSEDPQAPWARTSCDINLNWHHVIPRAMMRDAWQTLMKNRELGKCRVALESYMRLVRVPQPRQYLNALSGAGLSFEQQEELNRLIVWPSWNVVEGPQHRTDDRKGADWLDEFTAGLTPVERNRQARIKSLFTEFQIFNRASTGSTFSEAAASGVAAVMNTVERTLLAGDVIRYRPGMWTQTQPPDLRGAALGVTWWQKRPGTAPFDRPSGRT